MQCHKEQLHTSEREAAQARPWVLLATLYYDYDAIRDR
jgi:hypothetical protein